jgi:branched-chain amino acid transport system ATP-binding protein
MPGNGHSELLRLEEVSARYGDALALEGISLSAETGTVAAVIGVNGAGKTTTLKVISGVMRPTHGEIYFDGARVTGQTTGALVRRGVAHCPEGRRVFPHMSVRENLEVGAFTVRDRERIAERLAWVWEMFPVLRERHDQKGGTLSGGEQQMLAIGRALMTGPKLLLLDEPTLGLAPKIMRSVGDMIRRIRDEGVSIILVEQNAEIALELADHAYVLESGHVRLEGLAAELRESDFVRKVYLGI